MQNPVIEKCNECFKKKCYKCFNEKRNNLTKEFIVFCQKHKLATVEEYLNSMDNEEILQLWIRLNGTDEATTLNANGTYTGVIAAVISVYALVEQIGKGEDIQLAVPLFLLLGALLLILFISLYLGQKIAAKERAREIVRLYIEKGTITKYLIENKSREDSEKEQKDFGNISELYNEIGEIKKYRESIKRKQE